MIAIIGREKKGDLLKAFKRNINQSFSNWEQLAIPL